MEHINHGEQAKEIILTPSDVESAVRQFIVTCYPEMQKDWLIDAKYNLGSVIMVATKK